MKSIILVSLLLFLTFFSSSYAQNTTGDIEGTVTGTDGEPLSGALIEVSGPDLQGTLRLSSQDNGFFLIPNLRVGIYQVVISHELYAEATLPAVVVRLGVTNNVGSIPLAMQAYVLETMVVTVKAPLIDPASAAGGGNITYEEFSELPVGRDYKDMAILLPHANPSFLGDDNNHSGGTGLENKYFIDGVDVTDPNQGRGGTELPYNFIREVRVRSGGYEAEYRSSLGGILDVVTNTGSNEFHGQIFGFFTNSGLTQTPETNVVVDDPGNFTAYDFGFGVGGPITRDKLWFYAALNPTTRKEDVEIPQYGTQENKDVTYRFATKLNWRVNENNDIVLSVFGDPGGGDAFWDWGWGVAQGATNPDPFMWDASHGGVNSVLEGKHWLGDNTLLRTSVSYVTNVWKMLPLTEVGANEQFFVDHETKIWSGGNVGQIDKEGEVLTAGVHGTWLGARHTWKAGLEYRYIGGSLDEGYDALRRWADDDWVHSEAWVRGEASNTVPAVYLQDSWRVSDPLRLNLGVRWDGQIIRAGGETFYEILDQWQPRLGFTYQLGSAGSQQIFGSAGRFYQELSLNMAVSGLFPGNYWRDTYYDHDPRQDPSGGDAYEYGPNIVPEGSELDGQHFDEFTLGYERQLGQSSRIRARGVYRTLRRGIEDTISEEHGWEFIYGNMGYGLVDYWEPMKRDYTALELVYDLKKPRYSARASYVLSRNHGNYTGLFYSDVSQSFPNMTAAFDDIDAMPNFTGLLPNDRTHVLKLSGSYLWDFGLSVGTFFTWMSGTPLCEFGETDMGYPLHLVERGSAGRTSDIWSFNLRLAYLLGGPSATGLQPRIIVDLMNIGSPGKAVNYDQKHYYNNGSENPTYGVATGFQPPMSMRLGLEVGF